MVSIPFLRLPKVPPLRLPYALRVSGLLRLPQEAETPSSLGPSAARLLTLGMFMFGMETLAYDQLTRRMGWRHETTNRFGARPASQFTGPGEDAITIAGRCVPEIAGYFGAIDLLVSMADTGDNWPLVDGMGKVLGNFRIESIEQTHVAVLAGGIPRAIDFTIDLKRVD